MVEFWQTQLAVMYQKIFFYSFLQFFFTVYTNKVKRN